MRFSAVVYPLGFTILWTISGLCLAMEETPEYTVDGLQLINDSKLALVYAQPGADLGHYRKVYLADTYIAFKKNWRRDQNRNQSIKINAGDMEKIRLELSTLFRNVFSKTLEEGGYELVTGRADDVLLIKPAIINLDVIAPDTTSANNSRSYSESAGEMTLYLELYDSVTDDLLARALDRQTDRKTGYFLWQNRISNRAAANRILQVWANVLKEGLDEARG